MPANISSRMRQASRGQASTFNKAIDSSHRHEGREPEVISGHILTLHLKIAVRGSAAGRRVRRFNPEIIAAGMVNPEVPHSGVSNFGGGLSRSALSFFRAIQPG